MGTYTYWRLEVDDPFGRLVPEFRQQSEGAEMSLEDDGNCRTETKWYEAADDLMAFSAKYPCMLFSLYWDDENDEHGVIYAKEGKAYWAGAELVYDEFDESKLTYKP